MRNLNHEELQTLVENVQSLLPDRLFRAFAKANTTDELQELLRLLDMDELIETEYFFSYQDGIILVIGESNVRKDNLIGIIKDIGLDPKRFEFVLDYNEAKTYEYSKLQYNSNYRTVLFGATPHKTTGTGHHSSVIEEMKAEDGYPRVVKLENNGSLKITKTNFRSKLEELVREGYI